MNEASAMQKVVIVPTGSTEQHGRHLPFDEGVFLAETVSLEVGLRAPDRILVLLPVAYLDRRTLKQVDREGWSAPRPVRPEQ